MTFTVIFSQYVRAGELEARGIIQPIKKATLSAQISSRITRLAYRNGDAFKKGSPLVKLDCAMFVAQKNMINSQLKASGYKLENDLKLKKLRSIGELEVLMSQAEVDKNKAELKMADINVRRCGVYAPWNGYVIQKLVNTYENVEINQPLLEIAATDELEIELVIPANWLTWIKKGTPFQFKVDETGKTFSASVFTIIPSVDTASHTMMLRARFAKHSGLLPGMSGSAYFHQP